MACMKENGGTTLEIRKRFAARAFALSASYDSAIATWFSEQLTTTTTAPAPVTTRVYQPEYPLKYGCNPHQKPASISSRLSTTSPPSPSPSSTELQDTSTSST